MKYVEFKKFTDENGACPIYLFEGEEAYFREKGEELLKARFVQDTTLDYASLDGSQLKGSKIAGLVSAASCFPFISQKRLVKVTDFYPTEEEYDAYLKPIFENPVTDGILLIVNAAKKTEKKETDKSKKVVLQKKPNVTYVDCGRADEETIKKWIYLTAKKSGVYADGITCGKIASYCVNDMARISKETEKLLLYCQAKGVNRITDEIVDEVVYPDSEYKIFELTDALARKNYSAYMKIVNDLSTRGYNETALLSSLVGYFKKLYDTANCKGSDREVALTLGMKEFVVKKHREQAAKFSKEGLLALYESVYGAISGIKCGELTPSAALKTVTAKLFFEKL